MILHKLYEGKQVGLIYHVCTVDSYDKYIRPNDELRSSGKWRNWLYGDTSWISFTRDQYFVVDELYRKNVLLQLVIDGDKLSNHYKIRPYNDGYFQDKSISDLPEDREMEEAVKGPIKNISKYIKEIRFDFFKDCVSDDVLDDIATIDPDSIYFSFRKEKSNKVRNILLENGIKNGCSRDEFLDIMEPVSKAYRRGKLP